MITEDYINPETAKLLKEKGYNGPSVFYDEEDARRWNSENFIEVPNPNYDSLIPFDTETFRECLPHVTLAMVMKWLREVHSIHINIDILWLHFANQNGWMYIITKILENGVDYIDSKGDEDDKTFYSTYEQACEAAIKYCLENLI